MRPRVGVLGYPSQSSYSVSRDLRFGGFKTFFVLGQSPLKRLSFLRHIPQFSQKMRGTSVDQIALLRAQSAIV